MTFLRRLRLASRLNRGTASLDCVQPCCRFVKPALLASTSEKQPLTPKGFARAVAPWLQRHLAGLRRQQGCPGKAAAGCRTPGGFALALVASLLVITLPTLAAVPRLLNHQGRIAVNGTNFEGTGQFKFALVNTNGTTTYWSNDGTSSAGSQPTAAVSLPVTKGLYAVLLGDTTLANMTMLPAAVFENDDVRLRVWFNDGVNGFQLITPDQRLASAPFALNAASAESVPDASITSAKLASGLTLAGTTNGTFSGSLTGTFSGNGSALTSLSGGNITPGTVGSAQIADLSLVNADVSASAAIAYSKLNLGGAIVNADISASAAIADAKIATITTAGKVANSATTGIATNVPNTLVLRDSNGAFSAGTINGTFVGNGAGLTGVTVSSVLLSSVMAPPVRTVVAWGDNDSAQTSVPTLENVAAVAAGISHSLALLDAGTVVQWGSIAPAPGTAVNVTHIAAGTAHNLARRSDGTVIAWGSNLHGQTTVPGGITTATHVSAGEKHSLILRANGTVLAWGDNTFGQTTIPGTATNVTAIACGYDHNLALRADGTVIAWGRNDAGQTTVPSGLTNVVAIACGAYHSLAVKSDGTVVAWGWDAGGQVAGAAALTNIARVAGGYAFTLALKNDGTLVAFGDNTDGQRTLPSAAVNVTAIACGASHALALRADLIPAQVARLDQDNVFTGRVGIQRTPAANNLEVEGNASKTTAGNWLSNSDRRIKTDVQPITGAVEKLRKVNLVDFQYSVAYRQAHPEVGDQRYLNVIAQEFAEVFPQHVHSSGETLPDGSSILQVDTYPLTIYSAAAVQELAKENQALKKQLDEQEERLRILEERFQ